MHSSASLHEVRRTCVGRGTDEQHDGLQEDLGGAGATQGLGVQHGLDERTQAGGQAGDLWGVQRGVAELAGERTAGGEENGLCSGFLMGVGLGGQGGG